MNTTASFEDRVAFLQQHGTDALAHSSADLLAHLKGVHDLLEAWGSRPQLCDAGLFHSVYGTEIFPTGAVPLELRPVVRDLIGEEAETLVHLFGTVSRAGIFDAAFEGAPFLLETRTGGQVGTTDQQYSDLAVLTVANWLEQRPRFPESSRMSRAREFDAMRRFLPTTPRQALEEAYGFDPLSPPII
ncbi:hypothetical protein SAMN05216483_5855 [Streptomyces sp. 2131.1]|uniref:DUF6817 domain-containing protein n=1 Tax=Streptomyces sp. 2131.1 TaxID=1855346 RepID=UPI0008955BFC|nr:hypothetical protein [Streptomyces sp. 2131.1]SEE29947.1 hypothetical protein SAMN05216483_5855 [Streptomyces sp. 2131.1]